LVCRVWLQQYKTYEVLNQAAQGSAEFAFRVANKTTDVPNLLFFQALRITFLAPKPASTLLTFN